MAHPLVTSNNLTYELLDKQLSPTKGEKEYAKFDAAFEGDFWQGGERILLPDMTSSYEHQTAGPVALKTMFEKRYVSRNVFKEVVERVSNAILGKAPNWMFEQGGEQIDAQQRRRERRRAEIDAARPTPLPVSPDPAEPTPDPVPLPDPDAPPPVKDPEAEGSEQDFSLADEVDRVLGEFWTDQNLADSMIDAFEKRLVVTRGGLRIYVPRKFFRDGNVAGAADLREAISQIRVEFVEPERGKHLDDDAEELSIVRYERKIDWETDRTEKLIEFSFVDDDNQTFIGTVKEGDEAKIPNRSNITAPGDATSNSQPAVGNNPIDAPGAQTEETMSNLSDPLDLAGNTTFNEIKGRKPFVTDQMFQNNQLINLALTCAGFNMVDAGFGEMVITNVELETKKVLQPDGTLADKPTNIKRGGGVVNNLVGITTITDQETGEESLATPGVHFREPSSVEVFKDGKLLGYSAVLEEAGQLFSLISGDATVSGESRIQAMVDFYLKVKKYKPEVDKFGSWLLTTIIRLAAALCNRADEFKDFTVVFDSKIHIAKLTADERRLVIEMKEKGIISMETARVLLDIDDPDLEQELIDEEAVRTQPTIGNQTVEAMQGRVNVANSLAGTADLETRLRMSFPDMTDNQIRGIVNRMRSENAVDDATQER